jgi:hypothetical protein
MDGFFIGIGLVFIGLMVDRGLVSIANSIGAISRD